MINRSLSERLSVADIDTLREIMREAEAYLNAQWAAAIGADQRAYTFAGFCSAAAVVLVGGSYSLAVADRPDMPMATLAAVVAAFLLRAAWAAAKSAGPIGFDYVGNQPGHWVDDVEGGKPLREALAEQCQHYDEMIGDNANVIRSNARTFKAATQTALFGIISGAAVYAAWLVVAWAAVA